MLRSTLLLSLATSALVANAHDHVHAPHGAGVAGLQFHENKGQWPANVLYRARTSGGAVFVERDAFTYVISAGGAHLVHGKPGAVAAPLRMHAYKVHFEGAMAQRQEGLERMPHYVNYFLGDDPAQWGTGVAAFAAVQLHELYPGIGMRIDGHAGLKYDWLVAAGADASRIVMRYEGQDALRVEGGLLYIETSAGQVIEQRPVAWQEVEGVRRSVLTHYALDNDRVGFEFPEGYDERYALVIDPVVVFSTYSGSSADNFGCTATYDETGHLYGGGSAFNVGYPVTVGVIQPGFGGGTIDMGISKFSPDGTALIWSTYVGGSSDDLPHSMVVNSSDELYILGTTGSSDFPVSVGCFDNSFGGGTAPPFGGSYVFTYFGGSDVAVIHLDATATSILGATYVGGDDNDGLNQYTPLLRNYGDPFRGEIIMDLQERPVVATSTASAGLFTTPGASQAALGGGLDAYIFQLDPTLSTMLWATYHGGSANDAGFGVQVSSTGEFYVTGGTQSTDLPVAGVPFSSTHNGAVDGYLARYSADGLTLLGTTFIGTPSFDQSYFVQLDVADNVYVVGQTTGSFPVTPGTYVNPNGSQFLQKFSGDLSTSLWSTRIGSTGVENISPSAFLVSVCGQIYFSGWAGSTNPAGGGVTSSSTIGLPVTVDAYQATTDGSDFYLMVLEPDAVALAYATFFGGTAAEHVDGGSSRFDKDGRVYQAVCAGCGAGTFPTTPGAWSSTDMGQNCNLGVFKIDFEQNVQVNIDANITSTGLCITDPIVLTAVGSATNWEWDLGDNSPSQVGTTIAHTYAAPGFYTVTLIGTNTGLCVASDTASLVIEVVAPLVMESLFEAVPTGDCDAFEVEFLNSSTGSDVFIWNFGDGDTSAVTNPVHPYASPGTYVITLGVVDLACGDTVFSSQQVEISVPGLVLELNSPEVLCDGQSVDLDAGAGFDAYLWSTGDPTMTITVTEPGDYTVEVTDGFCVGVDTISVIVSPPHPLLADLTVCPGDDALLTIPFDVDTAIWNTGATGPSLLVEAAGAYWFVGEDTFGCPVTDTADVSIATIVDAQVLVPNVFTPNGDGENDLFLVQGVQGASYDLAIYDRWGGKVFRSTVLSTGWNGRRNNSDGEVPDGTYFVIVTYKEFCSNDPEETHTGHVTLLR